MATVSRPCGPCATEMFRPACSPIRTIAPWGGAISEPAATCQNWCSELMRPLDEVPVWSIVCLVVRSGHRKQGVTRHLIEGAVRFAAERGAPAVEAYPVDPVGRMDTTMAFVGTRAMFGRAGFDVLGQTDAVASKMPRLVMRRTL